MVPRALTPRLLAAARQFPVVTVTGPRQSGKTTLCRAVFPDKAYVSLVVENGSALIAVETKSGQTVADDMFAGLAAFAELLSHGRRAPSLRRVVVYGGAIRQQRSSGTVLPWMAIDSDDWTGSN